MEKNLTARVQQLEQQVEKSIQYSEYIADNLVMSINYSEMIHQKIATTSYVSFAKFLENEPELEKQLKESFIIEINKHLEKCSAAEIEQIIDKVNGRNT